MPDVLSVFLLVLCYLSAVENLNFIKKKDEKPELQVKTGYGVVQGTTFFTEGEKLPYYAFMGIPFAQPPVGPLRFRPPKKHKGWSGVLNATSEAPFCVELKMRATVKSEVVGDEDCLYINVFTPKDPKKQDYLYPVMMYMYGGAFMEGTSNFSTYGPDYFIEKGVILVTFNYRLNLFGFLSTEDLSSPGNYGLKDQNFALLWIQKNIRNFGGNPSSVTIFGQSAGATSVHWHVLSPKSRGLFHAAIIESGSALNQWSHQRRPKNVAYLAGVANGIHNPKDTKDLVERLRKVPLEDLKVSLIGVFLGIAGGMTLFGLPFAPTIEPNHPRAFISKDHWIDLMDKGEFNKVPIMMGINGNETFFFKTVIQTVKPALIAFDIDPSFATPTAMNITNHKTSVEVGQIVKDAYFGRNASIMSASMESLTRFTSDDFFVRPCRKAALLMSKHVPLYFYVFSYVGDLGRNGLVPDSRHDDLIGTGHDEELHYLFRILNITTEKQYDFTIRERLVLLWTNFAKYGNPTPKPDPILENVMWPPVDPKEQPKMTHILIDEGMHVGKNLPQQNAMEFWDRLFDKYSVPPLRTY